MKLLVINLIVNVYVQIFLKLLLTNFIVSLSSFIGDRKTTVQFSFLEMHWLPWYILRGDNAEKVYGKIFDCIYLSLLPRFSICNYRVTYDIVISMKICISARAEVI